MANRKNLTDSGVADLAVKERKYDVRDATLPGLLVCVEGSGRKTFYFRYSIRGRVRWYRIGPAAMGAAAAKIMAKKLIGDVANGRDPQAERVSQRMSGVTFAGQ